jgi:hypothetical protein
MPECNQPPSLRQFHQFRPAWPRRRRSQESSQAVCARRTSDSSRSQAGCRQSRSRQRSISRNIEQVDDFAMSRRQLIHAGAQGTIRFPALKRNFRRVSGIGNSKHIVLIDVLVRALPQEGDRPEASDRQQPCGNSRATFKPVCGAPDIEEHLTDDIVHSCADRTRCLASLDQLSRSGAPFTSRRHTPGLTPTRVENTRVKWL